MRSSRALPIALLVAALLTPPAHAAGGGVAAPSATASGDGGARFDQQAARVERRRAKRERIRERRARFRRGAPTLRAFKLTRPRLFLLGHAARVNFRIDGQSRFARVRLYVLKAGVRKPVSTIYLESRDLGSNQSYVLTGRENGTLPQGTYTLRIAARDPRGRRLRRAAGAASNKAQLSFFHHRHPLVGTFSYGEEGSRFGAKREGHRHQGQDMGADTGTPIVAPRGGVIESIGYQRGGAGHYAVLDGEGQDRDYVFMHMRTGSIVVREGQRIRTGQRIGDVGNTGGSSGPHLHFEVWVGGWQRGGKPIDPLPLLRAWDDWS